MPVAVVQEWVEEEPHRATVSYDAITERLGAMADPPHGLLMHSAGFTGTGFRIFEVWETRADFDIFVTERLIPTLRELAGSVAAPPETTVYELHAYVSL